MSSIDGPICFYHPDANRSRDSEAPVKNQDLFTKGNGLTNRGNLGCSASDYDVQSAHYCKTEYEYGKTLYRINLASLLTNQMRPVYMQTPTVG